MEPLPALHTLYERETSGESVLPAALAARYDGDLALPTTGPGDRSYVVANFVETLDGVVSFAEPGHAGGGDISGDNAPDRFIMGLLRARADAVVFGSGTLHGDPGHIRTAPDIYPAAAGAYTAWRRQMGLSSDHPLNVVVSGSGAVDLAEPTFHTPGLAALIVTTPAGQDRLAEHRLPTEVQVRSVPAAPTAAVAGAESAPPAASAAPAGVDPSGLLALLAAEFGVRLVVHEGGPLLLGAFLAAGLVDELFLTIAPQLAGRDGAVWRPALLEGHAFAPGATPWAELLSLKRAGSHLFLRYALPARAARAPNA